MIAKNLHLVFRLKTFQVGTQSGAVQTYLDKHNQEYNRCNLIVLQYCMYQLNNWSLYLLCPSQGTYFQQDNVYISKERIILSLIHLRFYEEAKEIIALALNAILNRTVKGCTKFLVVSADDQNVFHFAYVALLDQQTYQKCGAALKHLHTTVNNEKVSNTNIHQF